MEFGSDFHRVNWLPKGKSILDILGKDYSLYTDGRQALEALLLKKKIKRVWCPSYYCHESLTGVNNLGVEVKFYSCTPLSDQDEVLTQLPISDKDALIRMNYFGLHQKPTKPKGNFLTIEDHSHDLGSKWCLESDADWCFASLRKIFPIPEGGILWSPKQDSLPLKPNESSLAVENAAKRFEAMTLKAHYLNGENVSKDAFLQAFKETEANFKKLPISAISDISKRIVEALDIDEWLAAKKRNWLLLKRELTSNESFRILEPASNDSPFSLILLFKDRAIRDIVRNRLITSHVYPAILWQTPPYVDEESINFGDRILSIHCDARYSQDDITELARRLKNAIEL